MTQSKLNTISEHIHWLPPDGKTDRPVLGVIRGRKGTLLVDAGNSPAHARLLLAEMATLGDIRPTYIALTHWHWDHVFGGAVFDTPIIAHRETAAHLRDMAQLDWRDAALDARVAAGTEIDFCRTMMKAEMPDRSELVIRPPDITFSQEMTLDLGDVTCELKHVGGDHSADSTLIYIPEEKVVFLGDCLYVDIYNEPHRYTTDKLFPLIDAVLAYDADSYLLGHHDAVMSKAELTAWMTDLQMIGRAVERIGNRRTELLRELPSQLGRDLNEDDNEDLDAFLAGIA